MEPIQRLVDPWIRDTQARLAERAAKAAIAHAERMANLPAGTCPRCYGQCCESCEPIEIRAEGVPLEFRDVTVQSYNERDGQKSALAAANAFCEAAGGRDLFLYGGVGAGKTRIACAIANTLHRKRRMVTFHRVPMLLHRLQPGRDNAELEDRLLAVSVLVLDDLGAERDQATDYTRRTLLMLYEARHDDGKRTVFTSNKSVQEIAAMQDDDRLASRIAGRAHVVRVSTSDQRIAKKP